MKSILSAVLILVLSFQSFQSFGQDNFIQIETNKTLCLFHFLETSTGKPGTSSSFRNYILDSLKQDSDFNQLMNSYSNLNLDYPVKRQELPKKRKSSTTTKELLWIAASNSINVDDFSQRIIGYLPHKTHVQFIELLKKSEHYYDDLVWNNEQENILRIENELGEYKKEIKDLFIKISQFYNTSWSTSVPFKVLLCPIPLERGQTTAIPKGNALICSYLSYNPEAYKSTLGIIIHEMCHILYNEQSPEFQHQIEDWFTNSDSPYAPLAYTFFNEGLATVLGNGWANKQIHGELETGEWYNDIHIDGFAKSLYPLTERYLNEGKSLDQNFIDQSIELFSQTFPKAMYETGILMNNLQIFVNSEEESEINSLFSIFNYFNVRSLEISAPIFESGYEERMDQLEMTKLFIVDSDNSRTIKKLRKHYSQGKIRTPLNSIDVFKDEKSKSTLIIINIDGITKLDSAYEALSKINYIEYGKNYEIE